MKRQKMTETTRVRKLTVMKMLVMRRLKVKRVKMKWKLKFIRPDQCEITQMASRKWPTHSRLSLTQNSPQKNLSYDWKRENLLKKKLLQSEFLFSNSFFFNGVHLDFWQQTNQPTNQPIKQPNDQTTKQPNQTTNQPGKIHRPKFSRQASGVHTWSLATGGVSQTPNMGSFFF